MNIEHGMLVLSAAQLTVAKIIQILRCCEPKSQQHEQQLHSSAIHFMSQILLNTSELFFACDLLH